MIDLGKFTGHPEWNNFVHAEHRVKIKRYLRMKGIVFDKKARTEDLEELYKNSFLNFHLTTNISSWQLTPCVVTNELSN